MNGSKRHRLTAAKLTSNAGLCVAGLLPVEPGARRAAVGRLDEDGAAGLLGAASASLVAGTELGPVRDDTVGDGAGDDGGCVVSYM
jgi:hypothetical protein